MDQDYSVNTSETTTVGRQFRTNQMSLLSKATIIAGAGFIIIGLLATLVSYEIWHSLETGANITWMWPVAIISILVSQIMAMVAFARIERVSKITIAILFSIYILGYSLGFGILFAAIQASYSGQKGIFLITLAFAAGGLSFLVAGLIGHRMSNKAAMTMMKFVGTLSIGFFIVFAIFMILAILSFVVPALYHIVDGVYILLIALSTILFFLYMIFDFVIINRIQAFVDLADSKIAWNFALMFGFKLLMDLVGLVWNILILILRFSGK